MGKEFLKEFWKSNIYSMVWVLENSFKKVSTYFHVLLKYHSLCLRAPDVTRDGWTL